MNAYKLIVLCGECTSCVSVLGGHSRCGNSLLKQQNLDARANEGVKLPGNQIALCGETVVAAIKWAKVDECDRFMPCSVTTVGSS